MKSNKRVYVGMSEDLIYPGHLKGLNEAVKLGEVVIGLLTDNATTSYNSLPRLKFIQRKIIVENLNMVSEVVA